MLLTFNAERYKLTTTPKSKRTFKAQILRHTNILISLNLKFYEPCYTYSSGSKPSSHTRFRHYICIDRIPTVWAFY